MLVWLIAAGAIAGIVFRPRNWPEAVWACSGALFLVLFGQISFSDAGSAIGKGTDVYLFLTGMMLLAELGRREGLFDWVAVHAVNASNASRARLFAMVYAAGVLVTVFLSNDATAVVLTPAVYAAVKRAGVAARPHLFACAFVANAASFVLPISNPANLVVYGKSLPPLAAWLRIFALPSVTSIAATFFFLRVYCRSALRGAMDPSPQKIRLSRPAQRAIWGMAVAALVLIAASAVGRDLGLPTCLAAAITVLAATKCDAQSILRIVRGVSWSVLPLVAGLFVLVEAMNHTGASRLVTECLVYFASLPARAGVLAVSVGSECKGANVSGLRLLSKLRS